MIKTNLELVAALKNVVFNHKTLYVKGCFGAPLTASNKKRYIADYAYNRAANRAAMINAASEDTFGFDCICLIKGILWGWAGDKAKVYGGAIYASNSVPDISENAMIARCLGVSTTGWDRMVLGEVVWLKGHIGVYIGDGKVIECSPSFKNGVQTTACLNIGSITGMNGRRWTKHGKLPYITYVESAGNTGSAMPPAQSSTPIASGFKTGDIVNFTGSRQYASANAARGFAAKAGPAKITVISSGAKHPYHVIHTDSTSNVYGWVDAADISASAAAGTYTTYTVKSGDSLWSIAAKRLGNGDRYKEIKALNKLSSDVIHAGQVLKLPS